MNRMQSHLRMSPWAATCVLICLTGAGCASAPPASQDRELRDLARRYVQSAVRFTGNPAIRAQAMESAELLGEEAGRLIRDGLSDEHQGVRFAACMAVGRVRDRASLQTVRRLTGDPDASVRIGAYFALERMGEAGYRRAWAEALARSPEPTVRRNAALAMGQLGNTAVMPLLQAASTSDEDPSVSLQAAEAMAILGNRQAVGRFRHDAYGGVGDRQVFALLTLGKVAGDEPLPVLRARLGSAPYLEARLAAARSLGLKGYIDGFDLAVASLNWSQPQQGLPNDPPANQIMRVRTMAAMALGEIRDRRALPSLKERMQTPDDPRVQLAAATAMLMILQESTATAPSPG